MKSIASIRLLLFFAVGLSLIILPSHLSRNLQFPTLPVAQASPVPVSAWLPAGPAMDTEKANIFAGPGSELNALINNQTDLTDSPISSTFCTNIICPTDIAVTSPISEHGYFELQFDLSNNFWGVPFNFGNDAGCAAGNVTYSALLADPKTSPTAGLTTLCAGVSIRQGIAHLIDKNVFKAQAAGCLTNCLAIDNPVPISDDLPTPNSCGWDTLFPSSLELGPCEVGPDPVTGQSGGVSYHFAPAVNCGLSTCTSAPLFPWEPGFGTPDFCAAADHFLAAGLATGKDPNTCVLTGLSPAVTTHTVNIFTRVNNPRLQLGNSLADAICAIFTGSFQNVGAAGSLCQIEPTPTSVTSGLVLTQTVGGICCFPGFTTDDRSSVFNNWWIFTGAFINVFPFDSSLYGVYNGIFASNNGPNTGIFGVGDVPPCSTLSVPTSFASDYMYNCIPEYDAITNQMESAPCGLPSAGGDPSPGQVTPTIVACLGTGYSSPDFAITSATNTALLAMGTSTLVPVSLTALGSFAGTESISFSAMSDTGKITVSPTSASLTLSQGRTRFVDLTILVSSSVTLGSHSIGVTATGTGATGSQSHSITLNITATATGWTLNGLNVALTSFSTGYLAENLFGQQVVTIPVFTQTEQFAYRSNFSRVINGQGVGIPNFFTWLDAHTFAPAASGALLANCPTNPAVVGPDCFRQGFAYDTTSLSPYAAGPFSDFNIIGNIYDSLLASNPANSTELFGYMTSGLPLKLANSQLGYTPAAGTTASFRFTLRNDISFHNGSPLTSWDVKFSYITLKATGAFQALGLVGMTDVHVLSPTTFDVNLNTPGPFTLFGIGSPTIFPGRLWSAGGTSAWDAAVSACAGSATPDTCFSTSDKSAFTVTAALSSPKFDPVANGVLVGSGAFECAAIAGLPNPSGAPIGGGCSSTGLENPGINGYYQLSRFGAGTTPGTAVPSSKYFRSSGTLAVYIWTGNNGDGTHDFLNASTAANCFGKIGAACTQWTMGIGNPVAPPGAPVGFLQVSAVLSFADVRWTGPFNWLPGISYPCCSTTLTPPTGIATLPLTLYEGISPGNPGNPFAAGAAQVLQPAAVVGCTSAYPKGGYDC